MAPLKAFILTLCIVLLGASCKEDSARKHPVNPNTVVQVASPDDALAQLKEGNKRFVDGDMMNTDYKAQREATKDDQHPYAIVLSCMDARIPPEIVFDQRLGDLFVIRVAGNVEDSNMLGSIEYAVKAKNIKLILMMGHSNCGAVKGCIDNVQYGNLTQLVAQIKPAITGDTTNKKAMIEATVKNNVRLTMGRILQKSDIIAAAVKENKVKIAGAYYDLATGQVEFLQ